MIRHQPISSGIYVVGVSLGGARIFNTSENKTHRTLHVHRLISGEGGNNEKYEEICPTIFREFVTRGYGFLGLFTQRRIVLVFFRLFKLSSLEVQSRFSGARKIK